MGSVFGFHSFVIKDHHIASLAATVEELEEGVVDLPMFQLMSWKLLGEDGFSSPRGVRLSSDTISFCPFIF